MKQGEQASRHVCGSRPAVVEKQLLSGKPSTFFAVQISFVPVWHCTGLFLQLSFVGDQPHIWLAGEPFLLCISSIPLFSAAFSLAESLHCLGADFSLPGSLW